MEKKSNNMVSGNPEKEAIVNIKRWVIRLCRIKECCPEQILVAPVAFYGSNKQLLKRTIICNINPKSESGIIAINKLPEEICLGDILAHYSRINECIGNSIQIDKNDS